MKRTTYRRKSMAKKVRGAGRRVYKTQGGYRVSPECPRSLAKRRALIRQRIKTRRASGASRPKGFAVRIAKRAGRDKLRCVKIDLPF